MKIKYILIVILIVLLLLSVSQIFSIPPYAGDVFSVYKSGYFSELDREFEVIKDSFLEIKVSGEPVYGWIFLERMSKEHGIEIGVYDRNGYKINRPGSRSESINSDAAEVLKSYSPSVFSEVRNSDYFSLVPIFAVKRCLICHRGSDDGSIVGAMSFKRSYNAHIYYSSERIIIFVLISILLSAALYLLARWDPEKKIKEMFDNS